ncbi:MAG: hypothetical protein U0Q03_07370 [Acidimicrobiales bacterium]
MAARLGGAIAVLAVAFVTLGSGAASAATTAFVGLTPARLLETRSGAGLTTVDGQFQGGGAVGPGATVDLPVLNRGGVPASGVAAVALNVTVTSPTSSSYVTVYPSGQGRPNASNLNMVPGDTKSNMVIVAVGGNGAISLYNQSGSTDLIVDVLGWFPTSSGFGGLTPARLLETRGDAGLATADGQYLAGGAIGPNGTIDLPVLNRGGIPGSGVAAVALNVTVTGPTAGSFVTVYPTGQGRPNASNLNMAPGDTKSNMVIVPVGANGSISLYNLAGSTHLIVDVLGWFATGSTFGGLTPARLLETRTDPGLGTADGQYLAGGALSGDRTLDLPVLGRGGVPASGVGAVALNVTATQPSAGSFLTIYPTGRTRPTASNLNTSPGNTVSNMVIVPVGVNGMISLYNLAGSVHLVVDVLGWFPTDQGSGGPTTTTTPPAPTTGTRLVNGLTGLDTSSNGGAAGVAISGNGRYVAFESTQKLVPQDNNVNTDIYVRDLVSGSVILASVPQAGGIATSNSYEPSLSYDGTRVAFYSNAVLSADDKNGSTSDIYVRDLVGNTTTLVSMAVGNAQTNGLSNWPAISGNGRFVAFNSAASNLVAGDTNNSMDVFVRDLQTQQTERVSVSSSEAQATGGGGGSFDPGISFDGSRVVFDSNETSLWAPNPPSPLIRHVYMRDRNAGTTTLLTMATDGLPSDTIPSGLTDAASQDPSISSDGQWVVFHSQSPDLVNGDGDAVEDLFRVPATGGTITRIATNVGEGMGEGANVQVSSTGRYVAYSSAASGVRQVYRYDATNASTTVFSVSTGGATGNDDSQDAVISDDGKAVAFISHATNLAGTITGVYNDPKVGNVYVHTVA